MLKKIALKAGVIKDDTVYSSEGSWSDSNKIRFYNGRAQKIGGWEKNNTSQFAGAARTLHSWRDHSDNRLLAIGTNTNIYILKDEILYDITPVDGSFSTVTFDLQDTGTNYLYHNVTSALYGHNAQFIPKASYYSDYEYTSDLNNTSGKDIIRFFKPSHGVESVDAQNTPVAYYFNNVNIGEMYAVLLSATIINNSTNYFDIELPDEYPTGTFRTKFSISGQTPKTNTLLGVQDYFTRRGYSYNAGPSYGDDSNFNMDGYFRTGIGRSHTSFYFDAPFNSAGTGIVFTNSTQNSTNWSRGSGDTYLHDGSYKDDSVSTASLANFMLGNVVTDSQNRPTARRVVIRNRGHNSAHYNTSSSYFPSPAYAGGIFQGGDSGSNGSTFIGLRIAVKGKTYEGTVVEETLSVPFLNSTNTFYNALGNGGLFRYSVNYFAEIDRITFSRSGSTGTESSQNWFWDVIGSVSIAFGAECMSTAINASSTTFPALSSNGSTDITITKPIDSGEEHSNFSYGWGVGPYEVSGSGSNRTWGVPATSSTVEVSPRVWSFDNFGEDLVAVYNDGKPYYWDASTGVGTKAVLITNSGGSGTVPTSVKSIFVSSPDRHIVCLGANDPMKVRWSSQEVTNVWTENTATNTAGGQTLTGGSELIGWAKVRGQTLLYSDQNVHGMVFQGPPYTFGFKELGNACGLIGPNAVIAVQGRAFWMGYRNFFVFDGGVKVIPSPVAQFVFEDFNYAQQNKVVSGTSKGFNEIWWFYPSLTPSSATSSLDASGNNRENNRYCKYNYLEKVWDVGTFSRTAWEDATVFSHDISADVDKYLYDQEKGTSDDGTAFLSFIESSDFDIDDGEKIMFVDKALPDAISTDQSSEIVDEVCKITFSSRKDSISDYTEKGPFTVRTRDIVINGTAHKKTGRINPRLRGRQIKMMVSSDGVFDHWRLGDIRLSMKSDGDR